MSSETEALLGGHARTQCLNSNRSDFNQNFKKWFHVIFNLELAMALHAFAYGIHGVIVTNLYIEKACRYLHAQIFVLIHQVSILG